MDDETEIKGKPKTLIAVILVVLLFTIGTYFITKNIMENKTKEMVLKSIGDVYNQCKHVCNFKIPALINFNGISMECICLDYNGNSTNNIIQG